jgi:hypothetical protein
MLAQASTSVPSTEKCDAGFGWGAAFLPLKHTVLFYSLHPDRELV